MNEHDENKEQRIMLPREMKIRGRKKKSIFLGSLTLLLVSLLILWACSRIIDDSNNPEPSVETPVETPVESPVETPVEQVDYLYPERDDGSDKYGFRAAWLPSVRNLDYPERPGMSSSELKDSFRKILDVYALYNLNTVIMQVRPASDTLYVSALNPPSLYVTGDLQKELPLDLLAFAVEETHSRGMELHAWFNPFRVTVDKSDASTEEILSGLHEMNYARLHPEHVLRFDDRLFLDPGIPEVQDFVILSIMEVVRNYDIDGVHLDDYFYPYRSNRTDENGETVPYFFGEDEEDAKTFADYKGSYTDIKEWRRGNTYSFVKKLSESIHDLKPYVKLGVSPFGIWGHAEETDGLGSDTPVTSSETYSHSVFIDTRKWVREEIIDYVVPQIYWNFSEQAAPYSTLAKWWNQTVEGTRVELYIGHALYKVHDQVENPAWQGDTLIKDQIAFNNSLSEVRGSALFSFRHLTPNHREFSGAGKAALIRNNEALKEVFRSISLIPRNENLPEAEASAPANVTLKDQVLSFSDGYEGFDESEKTKYFIIYQFPKNDLDTENSGYLYRRIPLDKGAKTYSLNHLDTENYTYGVSAFNRLHVESSVAVPKGQ